MNCECILDIICLIGTIILLYSFTFKVSNFFDIKKIFIDHFKIFNGNYLQLFSVYITPIFIALNIALKQQVTKDTLEGINLIITVLTSMFFAIISILCSVDFKQKKEKYKKLVEETFNSTLFEIICCLLLLFASFILIFINKYDNTYLLKFASTFIYYLLMIVILNIFIILKRIKTVFDKNLNE